MFAAAPRDGFRLGQVHLLWSKTGSFVGPVAKRLCPGTAARAPPECAGPALLDERRFLGDNWLVHNALSITLPLPTGNSFRVICPLPQGRSEVVAAGVPPAVEPWRPAPADGRVGTVEGPAGFVSASTFGRQRRAAGRAPATSGKLPDATKPTLERPCPPPGFCRAWVRRPCPSGRAGVSLAAV